MGLKATLPSHIPACRSELKLSIMKKFSTVETVKEASAVCRSFLDGVVIFFLVWAVRDLSTDPMWHKMFVEFINSLRWKNCLDEKR